MSKSREVLSKSGQLLRQVNLSIRDAGEKIISFLSVPEKFFLVFAGFFGFLFVFLIPPMQSPDEPMHLYRAYQTSGLGVFAEKYNEEGRDRYGSRIPLSVISAAKELPSIAGNPELPFDTKLLDRFGSMPLEQSKTEMIGTEAVNVYSPMPYIPQAIGIGVGRIANASPLWIIWLGRLANLSFWLFIITWAIRFLPFAKWGLVILALNPVTVSISASLSGDVTSIGLAFLFVSLLFGTHAASGKKNLRPKQELIMLSVLALFLCLTKPTNIVLLPLLLLVPKKYFANLRNKLLIIIAIMAVSVGIGLLWNFSVKPILDIATENLRPGYGVNAGAQVAYIVSHPIEFITTTISNFVYVGSGSSANSVLNTYFGVFGWLDTSIPLWTQMLYFVALVIGMLYQMGRGIVFSGSQKFWLLVVLAASFGAAVTAMYLNYTPVGSRIFEGVQGRYFMAAAVVLLGVFTGKYKFINDKNKNIHVWFAVAMLIVLFMTSIKLFGRYYI